MPRRGPRGRCSETAPASSLPAPALPRDREGCSPHFKPPHGRQSSATARCSKVSRRGPGAATGGRRSTGRLVGSSTRLPFRWLTRRVPRSLRQLGLREAVARQEPAHLCFTPHRGTPPESQPSSPSSSCGGAGCTPRSRSAATSLAAASSGGRERAASTTCPPCPGWRQAATRWHANAGGGAPAPRESIYPSAVSDASQQSKRIAQKRAFDGRETALKDLSKPRLALSAGWLQKFAGSGGQLDDGAPPVARIGVTRDEAGRLHFVDGLGYRPRAYPFIGGQVTDARRLSALKASRPCPHELRDCLVVPAAALIRGIDPADDDERTTFAGPVLGRPLLTSQRSSVHIERGIES